MKYVNRESTQRITSKPQQSVGDFIGVLPIAAKLNVGGIQVCISSLDVFENDAQLRIISILDDGFEPPQFEVPVEHRRQIRESQELARRQNEDVPEFPDPPTEWRGRLIISAALSTDDGLVSAWPKGESSNLQMWVMGYSFAGDARKLAKPLELQIAEPEWADPFNPTGMISGIAFEPQWSIPLDLNSLIPAKEIDAR